MCGMLNEIPVEYFCSLDHDGVRTDLEQRPELRGGSVEYIAPAEYMVSAFSSAGDRERRVETHSATRERLASHSPLMSV